MKHLAHALAILSRAENDLQAQYSDARAKALAKVEKDFALRLRLVKDAKKSIQQRFALHEALTEEFFGELKDDTPRHTTIRIRKSLRRETERKTRHA